MPTHTHDQDRSNSSNIADICAFANHILLMLSMHEEDLKTEEMVLITANVCGRLWGRHIWTTQSSTQLSEAETEGQWIDIKNRIEAGATESIQMLSERWRPN